jgi:histone acetyltransferase (RNA polymerase elongator complex component)
MPQLNHFMNNPLRHYHIPIFIPDYGCPFRCIFCNQQSITGAHKNPTTVEIQAHVEEWLTSISEENSMVEIAFFGGNFTGIPEEIQQIYLEAVAPFLESGQVHGIRLSTRPDAISEETLIRLKQFGVKSIELGAQSMSDFVLKATQRGHTVADTVNASLMIRKHGFTLGLQMMVGLPGDDAATALQTAQQIIDLGADETRIYPLLVIRDTPLETLYHEGKYTPLNLEEAIEETVPIYELFLNHDVTVLKVGLHPTEGFNSGADLVAGPYHPNFRELVLSRIWGNRFKAIHPHPSIRIEVNPSDINHAVGFGSVNKHQLMKQFSQVEFALNESIYKGQFHVDYL